MGITGMILSPVALHYLQFEASVVSIDYKLKKGSALSVTVPFVIRPQGRRGLSLQVPYRP